MPLLEWNRWRGRCTREGRGGTHADGGRRTNKGGGSGAGGREGTALEEKGGSRSRVIE